MRGFIETLNEIKNICRAHTCEDCPFRSDLDPEYYDVCYFSGAPVGWNHGLINDVLNEQRKKGDRE